MTKPWEAEHPVDRDLAVELVGGQWPELKDVEPTRLGNGWDNDVWLFGELAFRFPRRTDAVQFLEAEGSVLPHIAPHLPFPVPCFTHTGKATEAYPRAFLGYPFVPGTIASEAGLTEVERGGLATSLGAALAALHAIPADVLARTSAPVRPPYNDPAKNIERALKDLESLVTSPYDSLLPQLRALLERPLPARPSGDGDVLCHGDLYMSHVLVDDDRCFAGFIDFGDTCIGERHADLSIAYNLLPPGARPAFWSAYGPVDEATRERARITNLAREGISALVYALDQNDEALRETSDRIIQEALAEA